jgi:hypothetical protein
MTGGLFLRGLLMLCFVFSFVNLTGCGLETKTLAQFYDGDLRKVTKVEIFDGNTGYSKTIENKKVIDHFLDDIKDIKFIPDENQAPRDGFNYAISLYQNGEENFEFGLTQVNDHYYHTEPDILPIVDDFYTNIEIKEE